MSQQILNCENRKEGKMMDIIMPVEFEISRETGEIIGMEAAEVREEEFRRIIAALIGEAKT
jgi:hypothetical protein